MGYITHVSEIQRSSSGNPFYDVRMKTSADNSSLIRIMTKQNPGVKRQLFTDKIDSAQPLALRKVYQTATGVAFYNSYRGSSIENNVDSIDFKFDDTECINLANLNAKTSGSFNIHGMIRWTGPEVTVYLNKKGHSAQSTAKICDQPSTRSPDISKEAGTSSHPHSPTGIPKKVREAVVCDNTSYFPMSVWEELIDIKENTWYLFSDVTIKHYEGKKLQTTPHSTAEEVKLEEVVDWTLVPEELMAPGDSTAHRVSRNSTITSADVVSVGINLYPICVNEKCARKVQILPGEKIVKCNNCLRKMLSSKCPCGLNCTLDVEADDAQITLTVFPTELGIFFQEDIIDTYTEKPDELEEKLLSLDNIDITYNKKNVITKIVQK